MKLNDFKYIFNSITCNSKQKWKNKAYQCKCKKCKKYYSWSPSGIIAGMYLWE